MKSCSSSLIIERGKSKLQWGTTSHQLEWPGNPNRGFPGGSVVKKKKKIFLPVQETWVWFLGWKNPTCHRATKPVHYNYSACALATRGQNYWVHVPQDRSLCALEPVLSSKVSPRSEKYAHHIKRVASCSPQLERSPRSHENLAQPKINKYIYYFLKVYK